jgi:hypothetical protein
MARTHRNRPTTRYYRKPHHLNEEAQLRQLLKDRWVEEYTISGTNRIHKRLCNLPDAWDDMVISTLWDKHLSKQNIRTA